jgi:hypothetical protein
MATAATKPRNDLAIGDSLNNLWDQYKKLSELAPSTVFGDKKPSSQRSLLRRAFLLYTPHTTSGWILHTLFYMLAIIFGFLLLIGVGLAMGGFWDPALGIMAVYGPPLGIALFILQRRARGNAARAVTQPEVPNA